MVPRRVLEERGVLGEGVENGEGMFLYLDVRREELENRLEMGAKKCRDKGMGRNNGVAMIFMDFSFMLVLSNPLH